MEVILVFLFGTAIGSFLNVLIDRIPRRENIVNSRSRCESCSQTLSFQDLVPVFSYIFLLGKCRFCKVPIPLRILFVEILTGVIFVFSYFYYNLFFSTSFPLGFSLTLLVLCSLIVIFFIDMDFGVIPDEMLVVLSGISLLNIIVIRPSYIMSNFITGIISCLFFLLIFLFSKGKGMGFGDVKFALIIGFLLGFPKTFYALYLAFLTGAFVSLILILAGKKRLRHDTIAFGPFLVVGIILAVIFAERIRKIIALIY